MNLHAIRSHLKIFLIAFPCVIVMWKLSPFEIADTELYNVVLYTLSTVMALCMAVYGNVVIYEGNKRDSPFKIMLLIFFNISYCLCLYSLSVVVILGSTCAQTEHDVYVSNSIFPTKIIATSIDCGAWDSESPQFRFRKVVYFTPFVRSIHNIDTSQIDKREWIFVGKNRTY